MSPEADDKPWTSARLWDETDVVNLGLAAYKIHEHGALAGVPLTYGGPHSTGYETRATAWCVAAPKRH